MWGLGLQKLLRYLVQNPKFLHFLAPILNYANTNLIYAIIIVYEQFESSSKMSTQVSSSVLFVTDFFPHQLQ
jgi:hypothetical protein